MQNEQNKINERFYQAKEKKNEFEVSVNYVQWGIRKHSKRYSMCQNQKLLGIRAWEEKNNNYVTQEVYDSLLVKCADMRFEYITVIEYVWQ
jgi:hypothetical protein